MLKKDRIIKVILAASALICLLASCSFSRGSLYQREKDSITSDPVPSNTPKPSPSPWPNPDPWPSPNPPPNPPPYNPWPEPQPEYRGFQGRRLSITTYPDNARIYLDDRYYGLSPLELRDLSYGTYFLSIEKNGFRPFSTWITYNDNSQTFYYQLELISGFLELSVKPGNALVNAGGQSLKPGTNELPVGTFTLTASLFGYETQTHAVKIEEGRSARLEIELKQAAFAIHDLALDHGVFNPSTSGPASSVVLRYTVTGPGDGTLTITDPDGKTVASYSPGRFRQQYQSYEWDGRDKNGQVLPDGVYTIGLKGTGANGEEAPMASIEVTIDSAYRIQNQTLWSGTAGLYYAPVPTTLAPGGYEINANALVFIEPDGDLFSPVSLGVRIGLAERQELTVSLASIFTHSSLPTLNASASYKLALLAPKNTIDFGAALFAKLSYQLNYRADLFSNPTGLSLGVPLELVLGPVHLLFTPELVASFTKVSYDPAETLTPGFYAWLYGRIGLYVEETIIRAGISASFRTAPFDEGFRIALPFQVAAEATLYFDGSPLFLTVACILEIENLDSFFMMGGAGFGILW